MISILREMLATNYKKPIKLFYACRNQNDFLYHEEIIELSKKLNMELHILISESSEYGFEQGRMDADYLNKHINFSHYQKYLYFICGTSGFVNSAVHGLENVGGIPMFNIVFEDFSVYS
ncbi:hypothetical protein L3V77_19580 [Vibrio sp. DW001]|uniref:hypothetical protein n=1 Tax=Vibrio sp. DW001 TaxID=2912315 RepID=UPI0023B02228|nr:hypothetical protein [Vibrio sp. DW001]WED29619.1 hypothetical protein L3V77_19580 [Vibrio sp. DW001]